MKSSLAKFGSTARSSGVTKRGSRVHPHGNDVAAVFDRSSLARQTFSSVQRYGGDEQGVWLRFDPVLATEKHNSSAQRGLACAVYAVGGGNIPATV
ncbi:hypothetical protein IG631_24295 [Alternaria alternata]|nr:hypothetical protein IG631_24295 [Alternaria alternata]